MERYRIAIVELNSGEVRYRIIDNIKDMDHVGTRKNRGVIFETLDKDEFDRKRLSLNLPEPPVDRVPPRGRP